MIQVKNKRLALSAPLAILMLVVALILAACGDPTATPAPTSTVAPTTLAATTAVPTTAKVVTTTATTTVAPTNAAALVVVPTNAAGLVVPTNIAKGAASAGAVTIPAISGATELALDAAFTTEILKQLQGLNNPTIKFYVSNDEAQTLADNADLALTGAGYNFGIPGQAKPTKQGDSINGFYLKTGSADILLAAGAVPADANDVSKTLNIPGITAAQAQQLADQVKGKKSLLVLIAAPGLLQSITGNMGGTTTPSGTSTTAAANGGIVVSESDVPVYTGAKRVDSASGSLGGLISVYYVSGDGYDKIIAWSKTAFADKGWTDVSTLDSGGGVTVVTGKKGNYTLLGTIVGPQAQGNPNFDSVLKQANAGPNDTVIAVVVTNG